MQHRVDSYSGLDLLPKRLLAKTPADGGEPIDWSTLLEPTQGLDKVPSGPSEMLQHDTRHHDAISVETSDKRVSSKLYN